MPWDNSNHELKDHLRLWWGTPRDPFLQVRQRLAHAHDINYIDIWNEIYVVASQELINNSN